MRGSSLLFHHELHDYEFNFRNRLWIVSGKAVYEVKDGVACFLYANLHKVDSVPAVPSSAEPHQGFTLADVSAVGLAVVSSLNDSDSLRVELAHGKEDTLPDI